MNIITIICSVPDRYECYLNDPNHPKRQTLKFNSTEDKTSDPGWSCQTDNKECLPLRYVCDGFEDCEYGSDENKGCNLYPGR